MDIYNLYLCVRRKSWIYIIHGSVFAKDRGYVFEEDHIFCM